MPRKFATTILLLSLALPCAPIRAQDIGPAPEKSRRDVVLDVSGQRNTGHITAIDEDGTVHFADGRIADVSQTSRIAFNADNPLPPGAIRREIVYRLVDGTALTAALGDCRDGSLTLRTEFAGKIVIGVDVLHGIECQRCFHLPRSGRTDKDILIAKTGEIVCDVLPLKTEDDGYGKLKVCSVQYLVDGETKKIPVSEVNGVIYRAQDPLAPDDIPAGWYAHVRLINGDRFYGVLDGFADGKLRLVTRCAGEIAIERRYLAEVVFSESLAFDAPNLLVCDANGGCVLELDDATQIVWYYEFPQDVAPTFAAHTAKGNVLVACSNHGLLYEIDRDKNVVWQLSQIVGNVRYPFYPQGLPDGRALVILHERNGSRELVELDAKGSPVRSLLIRTPIGFFDLTDDGKILAYMGSRNLVLLDTDGKTLKSIPCGETACLRSLPGGGYARLDRGQNQILVYDADLQKNIGAIPLTSPNTTSFAVNAYGNIVIYARSGNDYRIIEYSPQGRQVSEKTIVNPGFVINYIDY